MHAMRAIPTTRVSSVSPGSAVLPAIGSGLRPSLFVFLSHVDLVVRIWELDPRDVPDNFLLKPSRWTALASVPSMWDFQVRREFNLTPRKGECVDLW